MSTLALPAIPSDADRASVDEPIFVLCNGRSGSTLLRFLLDAHPELACPPETNLPALCAQLATVWSLIEGAPLSANRGDEPPEIPEAAIAGIRHMMDLMVGSYLGRKEKRRYCDKSLGTARFADLLMRVYPQAKFICLYRHPMDVIASGIEACPWGLSGFGFDSYIAETPGNVVLALARFWADNAALMLEVEEHFPKQCHRVRYEDLVTSPEQTAARIFSFLKIGSAPGISTICFSSERERFGPGDYKIWRTSQITGDSVGRGWSVPATMIAPPVLERINELAEKLRYLPVDGSWGTSAPPSDLRIINLAEDTYGASEASPATSDNDPVLSGSAAHVEVCPPVGASSSLLGTQLRVGLDAATTDPVDGCGPHAAEAFVAVAIPSRPGVRTEYWLVDMKTGTVTAVGREAQEKSAWDIVGSVDAWEGVIRHNLNLNVALLSCQLRYCDDSDTGPVAADTRLRILAHLLGIATW